MVPADSKWDAVELQVHELAARVAACPASAPRFSDTYVRLGEVVKAQSIGWTMDSLAAKNRVYGLLYGGRMALEEVMVRSQDRSLALLFGRDEPSSAPSALVNGVRIHSGDMLVSRVGAPTSALIARGSDHPGKFSHVALLQVAADGVVSAIEAHIERGVVVSFVDAYMADKKLRLMLVRVRHDLTQVQQCPTIPERAAQYAYKRATAGHVPYDFQMNYQDPSELFCSEVASNAYDQFEIRLWTDLSTISRPGIRNWLYDFGVCFFTTEEPADLEYDPQITVVAEWRDADTLAQDHIDNAVVDAMLERADTGERIVFPWYQLPVARVLKGYSAIKNQFGGVGPIPQGMSAAAALRNQAFTKRQRLIALRMTAAVQAFEKENSYAPPYWKLVEIALAELPAIDS